MHDRIVSVVADQAIDKTLDYEIPESLLGQLLPGMRVLVPIRGFLRKATVLELKKESAFSSLKQVSKLLQDTAPLPCDLLKLAEWMSRYYCTPLSKVVGTLLPAGVRKETKPKTQLFITSTLSANALKELCQEIRGTKRPQAQVLDVLLKCPKGILLSELLEKAAVSKSPVETLIKKKILHAEEVASYSQQEEEYFQSRPKRLHEEQASALEKVKTSLSEGCFATHLLYGITGSGKTEVYLQAIEYTLSLGKGAILLVPEIALTAQTIERLKSRFREKIAILHHRISHGERFESWNQIRQGKISLVVGARSALFSPLPHLGLVIVDEEHESSYKQSEEAPTYHARDVAVVRGKLSSATVLLGSATPSIESYYNALAGKYTLSTLTTRAEKAHLPKISIVDMQREFAKAKGFTLFSEPLIDAMHKRLKTGEQTLLFLNRRGYHTSQKCLRCAHVIQCPKCDVSLTFHLGANLLACHLCDYRLQPPPRTCPNCKAEGDLRFKGAGTEMVEKALHALLPGVRTLRLDADTTRHKGSHELLFKQFRAGKADLLIGTQMVAKGLHLPSVTLVGVLNADASLAIPDFRASETTFQLLTQVSGRAGRGQLPGEVIIQTHLKDHPVIQHAAQGDFSAFYAEEIATRRLFGYPPFTHLVKLTFTGKDASWTEQQACTFRQKLLEELPPSFELLPVIPSGHAKVDGKFRFQCLLKAEKLSALPSALEKLRGHMRSVHLLIDVDPSNTFF